ncbi:MAG: transcription antitermination protein NusB [Candidatus Coproplasma sp.]
MRTTARETLFKLIYSSQFTQTVDGNLKSALLKSDCLNDDDRNYCERVLQIIDVNLGELLATVDKHSISFPQNRIFPSDKAILLIALAEILYCDDIPDKVSMNEAANLASKYSSEKSASFITGILSAVSGGKNV